jgi:hypothetical protein
MDVLSGCMIRSAKFALLENAIKKARCLSVRANLTRNITCLAIVTFLAGSILSKRNIVMPGHIFKH